MLMKTVIMMMVIMMMVIMMVYLFIFRPNEFRQRYQVNNKDLIFLLCIRDSFEVRIDHF